MLITCPPNFAMSQNIFQPASLGDKGDIYLTFTPTPAEADASQVFVVPSREAYGRGRQVPSHRYGEQESTTERSLGKIAGGT